MKVLSFTIQKLWPMQKYFAAKQTDRRTDGQTDKRTDQKLYDPDLSMRGNENKSQLACMTNNSRYEQAQG